MPPERKKTLHPQAKEVIYNVIQFFEFEKNNHGFQYPVEKVTKRASAATGYCERTIIRIKSEGRNADASGSKLSEVPCPKRKKRREKIIVYNFQLMALRNIITTFFTERKEVPTLKKILIAAREDLGLECSKEYLRRLLIDKLGYKFIKCEGNKLVLVERNDMKLWRAKYLHRLWQNDNSGADAKPIVYLDETGLYAQYMMDKNLQVSTSAEGVEQSETPGRRFILLKGDDRCGLIPEAKLIANEQENSEINIKMFSNWLKITIVPILPTNAIITITAQYQGVTPDDLPSFNSTKQHMMTWLQRYEVPFETNLLKAQLYELIKLHRQPKLRVVDELLKQLGHEVLRLPPYNCDLNPLEYILNLVRQRVSKNSVKKSECETKRLTSETIDGITVEDWKREVEVVKTLERQYWEKEQQTDQAIEQLNLVPLEDHDEPVSESDSSADEDEKPGHMDIQIEEEVIM